MGAVLGFNNDVYIGYFSSEDIAIQEGCNRFEIVDDEYIGEDGVVFFVPYDFVVLVKSDHSDSNMPKGEPSGIVSCLCFVCAC